MFLDENNMTDTNERPMKEIQIRRLLDQYLLSGRIERDWLWIRYIEMRNRFDQIERSDIRINI